MKTTKMVEAMNYIDDDLVASAITCRRKKELQLNKVGAMVACFCLLVAVVTVAPHLFWGNTPTPPDNHDSPIQTIPTNPNQSVGNAHTEGEHTEDLRIPWTVYFNETTSVLHANRAYIKGYFTEDLNDIELEALEPGMRLAYMTYSGYAGFDTEGNLLDVVMTVTTTMPETPVTVGITDYSFDFCYVLPSEEVLSVCDTVEYRVYQYVSGSTVTLAADAIIHDIYFHFTMDTTQMQLEQAKADFQGVLECFAYYEESKPDLSVIVPEEIPELMEQMFTTLSEAQAEPDFGRYLPSALPTGFSEAAIRRFQFQDANYLSCSWSKGLDNLTWVISPYTAEDTHRLTHVEDKKNYDLSLYPIPRAESVPNELREIVDNPIFEAEELTLEAVYCRAYQINDAGDTDGWRMRFSVKYGDIIVAISTKGVEPEWLYQQLVNLIPA